VTDPAARDRTPSPDALRCAACGADLAHDQRYCVECGVRRGPLPGRVGELIASMLERGRSVLPSPTGPERRLAAAPQAWVPTTRAAATAVLGMLAFGVAVGSAASEGVTLMPNQPSALIVFRQAAAVAAAANTGGGGGGGGSGGGGGGGNSSSAGSSGGTSNGSGSSGGGNSGGSNNGGSANPFGLPPIKHVFVVVLSSQGYSQTFGSKSSYFGTALARQGEVLAQYYGAAAGGSLANEIALISGQGPTPQTMANCPAFTNVTPATKGSNGQVLGTGCVYPTATDTLATQLAAKHDTWKAYIQGLGGTAPQGEAATCRYPKLGAADPTPTVKQPYVTWDNPFVYFHADTSGNACKTDDVGLDQLAKDLKATSSTPNFSYIAADPCDNGSDQPCTSNAKSGLAPAETFLKTVVPEIEKSPAFKADGLLVVTFDQAPQTGPHADSTSCCVTASFPNLPAPAATTTTTTPTTPTTPTTTPTTTTTTTAGLLAPLTQLLAATTTTTSTTTIAPPPPIPTTTTTTTTTITTTAPPTTSTTGPATSTGTTTPTTTATGTTTTAPTTTTTTTTTTAPGGSAAAPAGGGVVGAVLISQYVKAGSVDLSDQYDHFALLASIEDLFGLKHLGYAGFSGLLAFDAATYNAFHG
jgi:hypothetical protein